MKLLSPKKARELFKAAGADRLTQSGIDVLNEHIEAYLTQIAKMAVRNRCYAARYDIRDALSELEIRRRKRILHEYGCLPGAGGWFKNTKRSVAKQVKYLSDAGMLTHDDAISFLEAAVSAKTSRDTGNENKEDGY